MKKVNHVTMKIPSTPAKRITYEEGQRKIGGSPKGDTVSSTKLEIKGPKK